VADGPSDSSVIVSAEFSGGWDAVAARLKEIKRRISVNAEVKAGVLGSADADLPTIAATMEYGSPEKNIPARAFLRKALNDPRLADNVARIAAQYYKGSMPLASALARVGVASVSAIQTAIGSNIPPPLAPSTIAAKGSSKTLIDTGRLRQSIHYEIVSKI